MGLQQKTGFILIERPLILSEAFKSLSGAAFKFYVYLINDLIRPMQSNKKKRRTLETNTNNLTLTYNDMNGILCRQAFRAAMIELIEKGFIKVIESGGLKKQTNIFCLSDEWKRYGTPDFKPQEIKKDTRDIGFKNKWKNDREKMLETKQKNELKKSVS